jgi:hypothetical protein
MSEGVHSGSPRVWRTPAIVLGLVALAVSFAGFGWTLNGHFVGDDFAYIGRFSSYPLAQWPRLFVEGWAGPIWGFQLRELRPIAALSFMIDAAIWGNHAWGYRVTNLLLHASSATMVGLAAWRAAERDLRSGIAATLLFALHPVHAEPVQWITGRVDALATTLYLAGFLAFLRYRARESNGSGWAVVAIYALSVFAKEFALTLPVMFLLADVCWLQQWQRWRNLKTWWPYLGCAVVIVLYVYCRRAAFGADGAGAAPPSLTNPDFHRQFAQRQLAYLGHLFPGFERWIADTAPLVKEHAVRALLWIGAAAVAGFAAWRFGLRSRSIRERRAGVFFGLGWYLVATLPLVVTYISPRHLYLASAGLCVALALLLRGLLANRWLWAAVLVTLASLYVERLSRTMAPWHTAAVISAHIAREVRAIEHVIPSGGALFLDVTEIREGAYVWTWAVPFALRPPFTQTRLDERVVVLESRGVYVDWERWHEQPAVSALRHIEKEGWILQMLHDQPMRRMVVPAEKVRAAAELLAKQPMKEFPHESWRKFINAMSAP